MATNVFQEFRWRGVVYDATEGLPDVLARVGYDPSVYTGFAFGMGPARIAMLKHGIEDIRLFHGNDPRFLRQFA